MPKPKPTNEEPVLFISLQRESWGDLNVSIHVLRCLHEDGKVKLRNLTGDRWGSAKMDEFEDYGIRAFAYVSRASGERSLIGLEPKFRQVHEVHLRTAERMIKVLRRWEKHYRKTAGDGGYDGHVGWYKQFARFVGAKHAVAYDYSEPRNRGVWSSYDDREWELLSIEQGAAVLDDYAARTLAEAKAI